MTKQSGENYSDKETEQRLDAALKRSLTMKPILHKKKKPSRVATSVRKATKPA